MDIIQTAERLHRAIHREGERMIILSPDGKFSARSSQDVTGRKLLKLEYHRVVGVYKAPVDVEWIIEDVAWVAKKYSLEGEE